MLGPGDFFGEGCLAGQPIRIGSATAITPSSVLVIEKRRMVKVLHKQHALSDRFIAHMLSRNIRTEQDLIDQLFNSSEKRLARALLLLARYGKQVKPRQVVPKISQETLSEMVGTTRSRVNFFMNKFKRLGFIEYNGDLDAGVQINSSLLRSSFTIESAYEKCPILILAGLVGLAVTGSACAQRPPTRHRGHRRRVRQSESWRRHGS